MCVSDVAAGRAASLTGAAALASGRPSLGSPSSPGVFSLPPRNSRARGSHYQSFFVNQIHFSRDPVYIIHGLVMRLVFTFKHTHARTH